MIDLSLISLVRIKMVIDATEVVDCDCGVIAEHAILVLED